MAADSGLGIVPGYADSPWASAVRAHDTHQAQDQPESPGAPVSAIGFTGVCCEGVEEWSLRVQLRL